MNVVTMTGEIKFQGDVGPRGPKGEKGDKPVVGVDYFTEADRTHIVGEVTEDANSVFNQNVATKTNEFNNNVTSKTTTFNENAVSKTNIYNQNADEKKQLYDNNATEKTSTFDTNALSKTTLFNSNVTSQTNTFDTHVAEKTTAFDENATAKTTIFNDNAIQKTNEFNANCEDKLVLFNEEANVERITKLEKKVDQAEEILDTSKASGENVYFDNAKNYPLMSLKGDGKSVQEAEPGPEAPQEIKTISEVSYRGCGKNTVLFNGEIDFVAEKSWKEIRAQKYNLKANTVYFFKGETDIGTNKKIWIGDNNSLFVNATSGSSFSLTQEQINSITRVIFVIEGLEAGKSYKSNANIIVSEKPNDIYEPYQESTLPIDLQGNELASVGTVSDKLLIDRKGNVAIEKNIWKMIIDGTEEWRMQYGDSLFNFGHRTKKKKPYSTNCISNYYLYDPRESSMNSMVNNTFGLQGNYTGVFFRDTRFADVESFVAHVTSIYEAGNPIEIYYELATPELIQLGTIENPEIFKGINNIVVETNLGNMNVEVEYVEDLQKRIEEIDLLIGDLDLALENLTIGGGVS